WENETSSTSTETAPEPASAPIASVQNRYNLADRSSEDVLDHCTAEQIAFTPWARWRPATWRARAARWMRPPSGTAPPPRLALARLLRRSPVMPPIPGTSKAAHVEENTAAARIRLSETEFDAISAAATTA